MQAYPHLSLNHHFAFSLGHLKPHDWSDLERNDKIWRSLVSCVLFYTCLEEECLNPIESGRMYHRFLPSLCCFLSSFHEGYEECVYAAVCVYLYPDTVHGAIFTCFHAGVCMWMRASVFAWKQVQTRNSCLSAVAVVFVSRDSSSQSESKLDPRYWSAA